MRLFLFYLMIISLFINCENTNVHYDLSEASVIANEIQKKVIFQLKLEKDLYPCEFGGGAKNPIRLLHCGFRYYNEIDVERSRELLFFAANTFLKEINSNEKIRRYLAVYPFEPENIEINIFLYNRDGSKLPPEKLHVITMKNGTLEYMIGGTENELLPTIYKENYNEVSTKLNNASFYLKKNDDMDIDVDLYQTQKITSHLSELSRS